MKQPIGGQAVIEGVMFKCGSTVSLAVRKPDGKIDVSKQTYISLTEKLHMRKVPIIRGFITFIDMFIIGTKTMNKSMAIALAEPETEKKSGIGTTILMLLSIVFAILLALGLFKFLPLFLTTQITTSTSVPFVFTLIEGAIKLTLFLLYIYAISFFPDIKRVFQYHGAEHKVIRCFESGKKLTIENIQKASKFHPRCGTSFLIFVILISICVYTIIPLDVPLWLKFLYRLALLPLVAGISYEVLYLTAKINEKSFWGFILLPGYGVQALTVAEPDAKQIQVSLASFNACRK